MRVFSSGLNRTWLAIIGLVVLLTGAVATMVATGLFATVLSGSARTSVPASGDHLLEPGATDFFANQGVIIGTAVLGIVLALLGLAWLVAQVPHTRSAAPLRLRDDAATGLTSATSAVLADVVVADLETLPDVTSASAVLRGSASRPQLTLKLTASDRSDVRALLSSVQTGPVSRLAGALDTTLEHLGVQVDVSPERRTSDSVTL
ncbi:hypothetical protein BA895_07605 [Humibacillus sp. DSM 29435]|uniref:hypothetical protein n=1 Tax=Humibacillus sp. DSM 29435 TaxID=1869167 RepID=UPI000872C4CF|nr:hypothetical protein [Humibacillus sp. DSM 29435]OFE14998.1 hypothetical protein BA895_07605 [Humibacillus sp. DSM 29435]